jgi:chemotaxis protein CheD
MSVESKIVVGVGDLKVSKDSSKQINTYALGSCIGLTVFDPQMKVGGMLHFMLPQPGREKNRADLNPYMFGSTGIPSLFKQCYALGAVKERLIVCAAGGAEVMTHGKSFAIGERNRTIMRKIFWKNNIVLAAEDTGGNDARTMVINLETGKVTLRVRGKEVVLWQP